MTDPTVCAGNPLVSVLMPIYNGASFLAGALDSATAQSYQNIEIVLVDNNSGDATPTIAAEFAEKDPRIKVVTNPKTVPVIENHNIAFAHACASSRYCKVLHADDLMDSECIAEMVELAERHPEIGMVGSWSLWGEETRGQIAPFEQNFFAGKEIGRRTLLGEVYPFQSPSCLMIRTALLRDRGGFYIGNALHADVDNALDLLKITDYGCVQRVLTHIRDHAGSVTSTQAKPMNALHASNLKLLVRHRADFLDDAEFEHRLEERFQRYYLVLARCAVEGRPSEFWALHRAAMAETGRPLSRFRLWKQILALVLRYPRANVGPLVRQLFKARNA